MRTIVILRPEPGASATAVRAQAEGLDAIAIPLFAVQATEWSAPDADDLDGLVVTSANAFRHGGDELDKLKGLPVHAVGEATARAAHDAGFAVASVGEGGAKELGEVLSPGRYVHLTGVHHMTIAGVPAHPCYVSVEIEPPPSLEALAGGIALVHSPRAGARLAKLVGERRDITIIAISDAAASASGEDWEAVLVPDRKRDDAMIALAAEIASA